MSLAKLPWERVAPDFVQDGSLRDVYVLDAGPADWQAVLDELRAGYAPLAFTAGGEPAPLPDRAADVFPLWARGAAPRLSFRVGTVGLDCHFFDPAEIEFSLDPAEVAGPAQLAPRAEFLARLARLTGKPALLTPENWPQSPILRANPASGAVAYLAPPGHAA